MKPIIRETTLADAVYDQLCAALMGGHFVPGDKVAARQVAKTLKVSFTPAREAVARLVSEGVLEALSPKTIIVPIRSPEKITEIARIRMQLEGMAAGEVARHATAVQIERLRKLNQLMEEKYREKDFAKVLVANEKFHMAVVRFADMPELERIVRTLWLQIGPSLNNLYPEISEDRSKIPWHNRLLDALANREEEEAIESIKRDIEEGTEVVNVALRSRNAGLPTEKQSKHPAGRVEIK